MTAPIPEESARGGTGATRAADGDEATRAADGRAAAGPDAPAAIDGVDASRAADGESAPTSAERRRRLQSLSGLTVHSSDGRTVGRVRDVYQRDATGELAALTVISRQLSPRSVLVPAAAIAALPRDPAEADADSEAVAHAVELTVDARTLQAGLKPPDTGHASPELLREAAAALEQAAQHADDGPPAPDPAPAPAPGTPGSRGEA